MNDHVQVHEVWKYNDLERKQILMGFRVLCFKCHLVTHLGFAGNIRKSKEALGHPMDVNGFSMEHTMRIIRDVFVIWKRRSTYLWSQDLSWLMMNRNCYNLSTNIVNNVVNLLERIKYTK
tara:strand:- start:130 stop:489 length:360 start_codon:yes stop_codon:yes gene_type:complete